MIMIVCVMQGKEEMDSIGVEKEVFCSGSFEMA